MKIEKVLIVGAGSIGGLLGVRLSQIPSLHVTFLARGEHLQVMREKGLTLLAPLDDENASNDSKPLVTPLETSAFINSFDEAIDTNAKYDLIIIAVKTHQLRSLVEDGKLSKLMHGSSMVLTTQNGVPWWFFDGSGYGGPRKLSGEHVECVDCGGVVKKMVDSWRIIGSVSYPAAMVVKPGVVQHVEGWKFPIGEIGDWNGVEKGRIVEVKRVLEEAGFKCRILDDVRSELWLKLWGSCVFNPVSALTHTTLAEMLKGEDMREWARGAMKEVENVGKAYGLKMRVPLERRLNGAQSVGEHKTSMLQDVEKGRTIEIDGICGAVVELGHRVEVECKSIESIYQCTKLLSMVLAKHSAKVILVDR